MFEGDKNAQVARVVFEGNPVDEIPPVVTCLIAFATGLLVSRKRIEPRISPERHGWGLRENPRKTHKARRVTEAGSDTRALAPRKARDPGGEGSRSGDRRNGSPQGEKSGSERVNTS
jgi:hypothetical protein